MDRVLDNSECCRCNAEDDELLSLVNDEDVMGAVDSRDALHNKDGGLADGP